MTDQLPVSGYREFLLLIFRRRHRHRVVNSSMQPTLKEGDYILYDRRAYRNHLPCAGDIVIAKLPTVSDKKMIKRIKDVTADGRVFVIGDNLEEGTDSRHFGHLPIEDILGLVTSRLP